MAQESAAHTSDCGASKGLLGAHALVDQLPVLVSKVVASVNLDMPVLLHEFTDIVASGDARLILGAHGRSSSCGCKASDVPRQLASSMLEVMGCVMSVAGRSSMRGGVGAFTVLAMWLVAAPADATWSIVAVDPRTREVGSAGASCTPYVAGIVALAPDRGAIVAQAMSSAKARRRGARLLAEGASPRAIVTAISDPAFEDTYQEQQYGVAALGFVEEPAAFTGAQTAAEAGHLVGSGVSVQGNILTARTVLTATMDAFARSAGRPLAERLLLALEAGAAQGGDRRCGAQTAQSAYLVVARPSDPPQRPSIRYIVPGQGDGRRNPVSLLRSSFDARRAQ